MPAERYINNTKLHTLGVGTFEAVAQVFFFLFLFVCFSRQTEEGRGEVEAFLYLVEVLEAFISQRYGNGEDGVGGVLVEAGLAVSPEQSQRPASADTRTAVKNLCKPSANAAARFLLLRGAPAGP